MTGLPMIIDTDPGVDDAVALALAAGSPEVDLLAITTVFGNVGLDTTTSNALRLRELTGLGHVPVAAGAARPLVRPQAERAESWHAVDGLGGRAADLPEPEGPLHARGAVSLLADLLLGAEQPVTLVAIGPLTNIALLFAAYPEVKPQVRRLVVMGGSLAGGNTTPVAEFNVHCDPEAACRVLVEEDVPTTLVPLDLTLRCTVDTAWLAELAAAGPRCALLAGVVDHYRRRFLHSYGRDEVALHDALAVLEAALPGTLRTTPMPLDVVCDLGPRRGALLADRRPAALGRLVDVALEADREQVNGLVLDRLRALG